MVNQLLHGLGPLYAERAVEPRVVLSSSLVHHGACGGRLDIDGDLSRAKQYNPFKQYCNSKMYMLLFAKELNCRMGGNGPMPKGTAVAVHPGIVDTDLARQYFINDVPRWLQPVAVPILQRIIFPAFLRSCKLAADTMMFACVAPNAGGCYIADGGVAPCCSDADDRLLAARLWALSSRLVELKDSSM